MAKFYFSLKSLRFKIIFFLLSFSVFALIWSLFIYFIFLAFSSFTEGATLLQKYAEEYFIFSSEEGRKLISEDRLNQISNKFQGFLVFDDLLNFVDRDYGDIEKIWLDFGMEKNEIYLFVFATRVFRLIPFLVSDIKDASSKIRLEYENNFVKGDNIEYEKIQKVIGLVSYFQKSSFITMNRIIIIVSVFTIVIVVSFILLYVFLFFKDLKILFSVLSLIPGAIFRSLQGNYEKIDLVDEKSEELYPLQNATNLVVDNFERIYNLKQEVRNTLMSACNDLEKFIFDMSSATLEGREYISMLQEIKFEELSDLYNKMSENFSSAVSDLQNLYENFDRFRSSSVSIFEPISTVYDLFSRVAFEYKSDIDLITNYIEESTIFVESIKKNLNLNKELLDKSLSDLTRASQKLRAIGINSSVEFSRSQISNIEGLKSISNKIIELSKNLSQIFSETNLAMSEMEIKIISDIEKISGFVSSLKEESKRFSQLYEVIKDISIEGEKVKLEIEKNYSLLSDIFQLLNQVELKRNNITEMFYSFENYIKKLLDITLSLQRFKEVFSSIEYILTSVQKALDNLKAACDIL
ncbi:MAG: hypothetical protein ACP5KI_04080 [Brevinematia bacterium]